MERQCFCKNPTSDPGHDFECAMWALDDFDRRWEQARRRRDSRMLVVTLAVVLVLIGLSLWLK